MTITEVKQKREEIRTQMRGMVETAKVETRELTEDEQTKFDELIEKVEELENEMDVIEQELASKERSIKITNKQTRSMETSIIQKINANERNITMPFVENRSVQVQAGLGLEAVGTDILNGSDPLRNNLILNKLGQTIISGVSGNQQIPVYSGTSQNDAGETDCVTDTAGTWTEKTFSPKRATAVIPVSNMWLLQENAGAEEMLKRDIIKALTEQIEKNLLGDTPASQNKPAGIGSVIAPTTVTSWTDTVAIESALQNANYNNFKYGLNPMAKGFLTTLPKDSGSGLFALDNQGVNGNGYDVSGNVFANGGVVGDWSQFMLFIWGDGIQLTIDAVTLANCGQTRIIANMYYDGGVRDMSAFKTFTV